MRERERERAREKNQQPLAFIHYTKEEYYKNIHIPI